MLSYPKGFDDMVRQMRSDSASKQTAYNDQPEKSQNIRDELEVRFKTYRPHSFSSGVNFKEFRSVLNHYQRNHLGIFTETTDLIGEHDGRNIRFSASKTTSSWIEKKVLSPPLDDREHNLRYAFSREIMINPILELQPSRKREKERYSFPLDGGAFRLDLTKVKETDLKGKSIWKGRRRVKVFLPVKIRYEIELEVMEIGWGRIYKTKSQAGGTLIESVTEVFKLLHNTSTVYSVRDYNSIVQYVNGILRDEPDERGPSTSAATSSALSQQMERWENIWKISHKILFQPRNIKAKDMMRGGLIGNPKYQYNITIKADGIRKLMVIHPTGIWFIMAPDQADLAYPFNFTSRKEGEDKNNITSAVGIILEGELIPENKRNPGATEAPYWFLVYDCLAIPTANGYGNKGIQKKSYSKRMHYARSNLGKVIEETKDLISIGEKSSFKFFSAEEMFSIIQSLERGKAANVYKYKDDGYIFTARQMPYDLKVNYENNEYVTVTWEQVSEGTWQNEHGMLIGINRQGNKLVEYVPSVIKDKLVKLVSSDAFWYSTKTSQWQYNSRNGVWYSVGRQRGWSTVKPIIGDKIDDGARRGIEIMNKLEPHGTKFTQTIKIKETGRKRIFKIPLRLRVLTRYPDICKWKKPQDLTIDFAIRRDLKGNIQLLVGGFDYTLIPFVGTTRFPFLTAGSISGAYNPQQPYGPVDSKNKITEKVPNCVTDEQGRLPKGETCVIIEYEWDFEQRVLKPRKIREDKTKPNRRSVANSVWEDIQNPIDLPTIQGETFAFMRRYHNRIKWQLYDNGYRALGRNSTLLDIGSGIGGDVFKWSRAWRIVAVEPNSDFITELVGRVKTAFHQSDVEIIYPTDRDDIISAKLIRAAQEQDKVVVINTVGEDSELISGVVKNWLGGKAMLVSIMLSFSFFWQSEEKVRQLARTIIDNLQPNGRGMFFTIDGRIVRHAFHPMLMTNGEPKVDGGLTSDKSITPLASGSKGSAEPLPLSIKTECETISRGNQMVIGGQASNEDSLSSYNRDILKYSYPDNTLIVNIPGSETVAVDQKEWLVYLDDLARELRPAGFNLISLIRADRESFMSVVEYRLSSLYTGGYILPLGVEVSTPPPLPDILPLISTGISPTVELETGPSFLPKLEEVPVPSTVIKSESGPSKREVTTDPSGAVKVVSPGRKQLRKPSPILAPSITIPDTTPPLAEKKVTPVTPVTTITPPSIKPITTLAPGIKPLPPLAPGIKPLPPLTPLKPVIGLTPVKGLTPIKPPAKGKEPAPAADSPLPMLRIYYNRRRDIGIGDDVVEKINVKWYKERPVVRIATIAMGSCFFHAVLKAYYPPYANTSSFSLRKNIVTKLRRDLASLLEQEDSAHPGKTYYQTASSGHWVIFAEQQALGVKLSFDPRLEGMQTLFNSRKDVGEEVFKYVAEILSIDIYVMRITQQNMAPHIQTDEPGRKRPIIMIGGNGYHYETLGLDHGPSVGIQTVFMPDDEIITEFKRQIAARAFSPK